jgi:hypothetical protein
VISGRSTLTVGAYLNLRLLPARHLEVAGPNTGGYMAPQVPSLPFALLLHSLDGNFLFRSSNIRKRLACEERLEREITSYNPFNAPCALVETSCQSPSIVCAGTTEPGGVTRALNVWDLPEKYPLPLYSMEDTHPVDDAM